MFLLDGKHLLHNDFKIRYLLEGQELSIGRKDTDIIVKNDKSISRKHALLKINQDHILVTDCDTTYLTYIDNVKLQPNVPTIVKGGSKLKLGGLHTTFNLEYIQPVLVCCSGFSVSKTNLLQQLDFINGKLSQTWTKECTHLTMEKYIFTPKVLCALVEDQCVVSIKFWKEYIAAVKENKVLPKPEDYKPPLTESSLNPNIDLTYKPGRKILFKNKIFVFNNAEMLKEMKNILNSAGGDGVTFNNLTLTKEEVLQSTVEYIFIQGTNKSQNLQKFDEYIEYFKKHERYSVPVSDIGLAVMYCSCERHANSYFNKAKVLNQKAQSERKVVPKKEIVPETQPLTEPLTTDLRQFKEEIVIGESEDTNAVSQIPQIPFVKPINPKTCTNQSNKRKEPEVDVKQSIFKQARIKDESTGMVTLSTAEESQRTVRTNPFAAKLFTNAKKRPSENLAVNTTKKFCFDTTTKSGKDLSVNQSKDVSINQSKDVSINQRKDVSISQRKDVTIKQGKDVNINPFSMAYKSKQKAKNLKDQSLAEVNSDAQNKSVNNSKVHFEVEELSAEYCNKFDWISRDNRDTLPCVDKSNVAYDKDVQDYIDGFKNIKWEITVISNTLLLANLGEDSGVNASTSSGNVNYKKFKKVPPKYPQKFIVTTHNDKALVH